MSAFYSGSGRVTNDWLQDVLIGVNGSEHFDIQFFTTDVMSGVEDILAEGSPLPFQTAPFKVRIQAGGDAADGHSGRDPRAGSAPGARRVSKSGGIHTT